MLSENNENFVLWTENIFNAVNYLSDLELQKLTWSGEHPEFIYSFTETLAALYDDLDFERYITNYKLIKGIDESNRVLSELNELIKHFKKLGYETELEENGYLMILNDNNWIDITQKALEFIQICHNLKK